MFEYPSFYFVSKCHYRLLFHALIIGNTVTESGANRTALPIPNNIDLMNVHMLPILNFEVTLRALFAILLLATSLII